MDIRKYCKNKEKIMGCHTWFYKRTTIDEIQKSKYVQELKDECDVEIDFQYKELSKIPDFDIHLNGYFRRIPIQRNPKTRDKQAKYHYLNPKYIYYEEVKASNFHDTFRIKNYPYKKIHNLRQLKRYLGKRYYKLTEEQINRLKLFWTIYPNGMIDFS